MSATMIKKMLRGSSWGMLKLALGVTATCVLMGANDEGCGGDEPVEPPPEACPPGHHVEMVCDDDCGPKPLDHNQQDPSCYETCVPDSICPDGTYEEWVCEGGDDVVCLGLDCPEPQPREEKCYPTCVPCGPGMREEWICEVRPEPLPDPMIECNDPGCDPVPPPEECYSTCVPIEGCEPGYHEEWICEARPYEDPNNTPPEDVCYPICTPDNQCPPDTYPVFECDEYDCWETCVGRDPNEPPPEPQPM